MEGALMLSRLAVAQPLGMSFRRFQVEMAERVGGLFLTVSKAVALPPAIALAQSLLPDLAARVEIPDGLALAVGGNHSVGQHFRLHDRVLHGKDVVGHGTGDDPGKRHHLFGGPVVGLDRSHLAEAGDVPGREFP